jgi:phosphonate transport system ATP-binding protein
MFEFSKQTARYNGKAVLSDLSLSVNAGEKIALVGKSGSGKTTLLELMYEQCADRCALIPQNLGLVESLSVFHNTYMGRLDKHSPFYNITNLFYPLKKEKREVSDLLKKLSLDEKIFTPVGELSGGEQQRTAIARALYTQKEVLLGDEPVSSLDEHQSQQILKAILNSHETVVLALHDVKYALQFTDRVIGLNNGQIALDAPTSKLKSDDLIELYQDE